jgi:hypothetical protein
MRLGLKHPQSLRKIQRDQKVPTTTREIFSPKVENMDFKFLFIYCCEQLTSEILDNTLFFGYMGNIFLEIISIIIDTNCKNMNMMMGVTRRDVFFA